MRLHRGCALAVVVLSAGCAAVQQAAEANRNVPAAVAGNAFAPGRPPNPQYGSSAGYACPTGGVAGLLKSDIEDASKDAKREPPPMDARLCAAADTFLGWKDPAVLPPESVTSFTSWYFGSPTPSLRIVAAVLETEDARQISERLLQPLNQFAATAGAPRWGLATQRVRKNQTRLVLAMQDAAVELAQPLPRQLAGGASARLEGKALGDVAKTTVLTVDPSGHLETVGPKEGPAFAADVKCGEKPGIVYVEVRGEEKGAGPRSLARFPVACGVDAPKSTPLPRAEAAGEAPEQAERRLLDGVNALRAAAGVPPVELDPAVARVARDASQAQSRATGSTVDFDVGAALAKAEAPSPLVLLNPAAAFTPDEAQWRLSTSPMHRANMLNPQATHAGVGVTSQREGQEREAATVYFVTQLLVRELPPIDAEAMRAKVRDAVAARRRDSRAEAVKPDSLLEDVAQKYAVALAGGKGKPPDQTLNDVVAPLYKAMRVVSVTAGTKLEPLEIVEEPGVVSAGKVLGVGVAQGFNTVLGKNAVYVAIIVGSRK